MRRLWLLIAGTAGKRHSAVVNNFLPPVLFTEVSPALDWLTNHWLKFRPTNMNNATINVCACVTHVSCSPMPLSRPLFLLPSLLIWDWFSRFFPPGFWKAVRDNLDCHRCWINKVELNRIVDDSVLNWANINIWINVDIYFLEFQWSTTNSGWNRFSNGRNSQIEMTYNYLIDVFIK